MTAAFSVEDVRLQLVAQVQAIPGTMGWKHARHVFSGVESQGNAFGDRSFDVRAGRVVPLNSGRGGAEYCRTAYTVRLRHRLPPKEGPETYALRTKDVRKVEVWLRERGGSINAAVRVQWVATEAPKAAGDGVFLDTDIQITADHWQVIEGGPDGRS